MLRGHDHSHNVRGFGPLNEAIQFSDVKTCYHQRLFDREPRIAEVPVRVRLVRTKVDCVSASGIDCGCVCDS